MGGAGWVAGGPCVVGGAGSVGVAGSVGAGCAGGPVIVVVCGGPHAIRNAAISNSRILMRASYTPQQMGEAAMTPGRHE